MNFKKPDRSVPLGFLAYYGFGLVYLYWLDKRTPKPLSDVIEWFLWPLSLLFRVFMPVLKALKLTEGDWIVLPSAGGWILMGCFYAGLSYLIGRAISMKRNPQ